MRIMLSIDPRPRGRLRFSWDADARHRGRRQESRRHPGRLRRAGGASVPVSVVVDPAGRRQSRIGSSTVTREFTIVDGALVTRGYLSGTQFGASSQSKAILSEKDGKMTLAGNGQNDRGPYSYGITKR